MPTLSHVIDDSKPNRLWHEFSGFAGKGGLRFIIAKFVCAKNRLKVEFYQSLTLGLTNKLRVKTMTTSIQTRLPWRALALTAFTCLMASSAFGGAAANTSGKKEGGLTESQYHAVLDGISERYNRSGVLKPSAESFYIQKDWRDDSKNAGSAKRGRKWSIRVLGGLARLDGMTEDGLAMIACRLIGNLAGGFPYWERKDLPRDKAMSRGNNPAYYSTFVCTNHLWGHKPEDNAKSRAVVDEESQRFCDSVFADTADQNLCYRKLIAVRVVLTSLHNSPEVSTDTPDETIVDKTIHGGKQCEFDTLLAGAACGKYSQWKHGEYPMTEQEMAEQSCAAKATDYPYDSADVIKQGLRPFCWFKPQL